MISTTGLNAQAHKQQKGSVRNMEKLQAELEAARALAAAAVVEARQEAAARAVAEAEATTARAGAASCTRDHEAQALADTRQVQILDRG